MGERVALNFVQRMCGVATQTRAYVDAVPAGAKARITDTRKTTPGLRALERYAVRVGGGHNHRDDLGAAVLIKDNHIAACGGVRQAIERARAAAPHTTKIECEVDSLEQLDEALAAGADIVLLDNMDVAAVAKAVAPRARARAARGVGRHHARARRRARARGRRRHLGRRAHPLGRLRPTSASTSSRDSRRGGGSGARSPRSRAADRRARDRARPPPARPRGDTVHQRRGQARRQARRAARRHLGRRAADRRARATRAHLAVARGRGAPLLGAPPRRRARPRAFRSSRSSPGSPSATASPKRPRGAACDQVAERRPRRRQEARRRPGRGDHRRLSRRRGGRRHRHQRAHPSLPRRDRGPRDVGALSPPRASRRDRATLLAARAGVARPRRARRRRRAASGLVRARLEAADALRGKRVRSDSGDEGVASGIDDDGRLLVRRDDGVLARWSAGEVHIIL